MASHIEYGLLGNNLAKLIQALTAEDPEQRYLAAIRLGELKQSKAVKPLITALADSEAQVRAAAAEALGELGDPRAINPLLQALADPVPYVSKYAAMALGLLKDQRAIQPLLHHLGSSDHYARRNPAEILTLLLIEKGVFEPLLTILLQDQDYSRRVEAANALGGLKAQWAVEALLQARDDPNQYVRSAVARALKQIEDPN